MFVAILHRIDGEKEEDECKFEDVPSGAYYEKAVAWASTNGIVAGISATEFDPNADITREQMAAILYRYANYKKIDTQVEITQIYFHIMIITIFLNMQFRQCNGRQAVD